MNEKNLEAKKRDVIDQAMTAKQHMANAFEELR